MSMWLDKYLPLYAPETEVGGGDPGTGGGAPPAGGAGGEGRSRERDRGSERGGGREGRKSVREELSAQFESARTAARDEIGEDRSDRGDGRDAFGRLLPGHSARRGKAAKEAEGGGAEAGAAQTE